MSYKNRISRRACLLALAALLALQPFYAYGEGAAESAQPMSGETAQTAASQAEGSADASAQPNAAGDVQYYAFATNPLKIRRAPDKDAPGAGSIIKGATVYIIELTNDDWAYIRFERGTGYVQRQYLESMTTYDGTPVENKPAEDAAFTAQIDGFRDAYVAYAVKSASIYQEPSKDSRWLKTVPIYEKVYVSVVDGDWCYARYNKVYGYIRCSDLFKWDRLVADAGEIPGLDIMPLIAFVKRSTNIYDSQTNKLLKTVNPGAALAVFEKDNMGRYCLPYHRTIGYITEDDVASLLRVEDYQTAQPGDLISVMSTYYAVGVSTLQYQGRNWNIHLASSMITGVVLQPNESYDQHEVIGPYIESTGYHPAPIMKTGALWGYGGGTCQVNTTFYITNVQVPIVVNHRRVHADVGIYYAKKGFDAAVGGGDINLILTNTLPYAIRYQFFDSDGVLTCCIFRES